MMLKVKFQDGVIPTADEATYNPSDLSLAYRHRPAVHPQLSSIAEGIDQTLEVRRERDFLAIADTLVVVFSSESRELIAFDAYTNQALWKRTHGLPLPQISGTGQICLDNALPGERLDLSVSPIYAYSESQLLLEISLDRDMKTSEYYRVSDRLVVRVRHGVLAGLLLQGLRTT